MILVSLFVLYYTPAYRYSDAAVDCTDTKMGKKQKILALGLWYQEVDSVKK